MKSANAHLIFRSEWIVFRPSCLILAVVVTDKFSAIRFLPHVRVPWNSLMPFSTKQHGGAKFISGWIKIGAADAIFIDKGAIWIVRSATAN
jgi:hypothetical protein